MGVYELGLDEAVIMQDSHIFAENSGITLVLTNQNIIQVNKNFWGSDKSAVKYPLTELKEYKGKPNVIVGKAPNGAARLELYFTGYEKFYIFQGTIAVRKWASAIEKAYKAYKVEEKKNEKAKPDTNAIFIPLKGALESAKQVITPKANGQKTKTIKCPRCGAELTGKKGQEVACSYCETVITIR